MSQSDAPTASVVALTDERSKPVAVLAEPAFDRLARLAATAIGAPMSLVTLIEHDQQHFLGQAGLPEPWATRRLTPISYSVCRYVVASGQTLVIEDGRVHPLVQDSPAVRDLGFVAYAGVPLLDEAGQALGSLCVVDHQPRRWSERELGLLHDVAASVVTELTLGQRAIAAQAREAAACRTLAALQQAQTHLRATLADYAEQCRLAGDAQSRAQAILDTVHEAIVLVDAERRFISVNRRFLECFGVAAEAVVGRRFDELRDQVQRTFANADAFVDLLTGSETDPEREIEAIVEQRWPQARELALVSTPVLSAGQFIGRLYAFRDITQERAVDRMKSDFVALASHELRTPMTSIKGYVDLLLEGEVGALSKQQEEFLKVVNRNSDRMISLINQLLDVTRIEAGTMELRHLPLHLQRLVSQVAEDFAAPLQRKAQTLEIAVPDGLSPTYGDPDRISQVLANLVSNAHKYTPRGGQIRITAADEGDFVRVSVSDSGPGLVAEEQTGLFTKFYRARNPATEETQGSGLGLALSLALIRQHGGEMAVQSAPDHGSTFSFTLPVGVRNH